MEQPITVGVDLAKPVFQLYGVDAEGAVVLRQQLQRSQMLAFFQNEVSIIGVNLAKQVFQLHGAIADGEVVFKKLFTHIRRAMKVFSFSTVT